jgi:hypothetical protein
MDQGIERVQEEAEKAVLRRQAAKVLGQSLAITVVLTAAIYLAPI